MEKGGGWKEEVDGGRRWMEGGGKMKEASGEENGEVEMIEE